MYIYIYIYTSEILAIRRTKQVPLLLLRAMGFLGNLVSAYRLPADTGAAASVDRLAVHLL